MTARELLIIVVQQTRTADLCPYFENDATPEQIADHILTSRDEETLNSAADDYEAATSEQNPGPILGAIRRMRAYKVGAFLRARADAATGYDRSSL
ncbi:hypothetical protein [Streptomyces sp. NPDC001658]